MSYICVTWLIHIRDMTHSCVWHDTFTCVTWLIYMCDMTHSCRRRDSFICVTWLIHMCDMTHSYVWHDSFIRVTWLIPCMWHDTFIHMNESAQTNLLRNTPVSLYACHMSTIKCVTWLVHMCDMTHSYVWHDSFIRVTWLIPYMWHDTFINMNESAQTNLLCHTPVALYAGHMSTIKCVTWLIHMCDMTHSYVWPDSFHICDMTHSYIWMSRHRQICCVTHLWHFMQAICQHSKVWHDSFICVTWLIHMYDMTYSYVWHDSFICVTWLIYMCYMTHPYMWNDSIIHMKLYAWKSTMGWLRWVGSLKLQVSFAKEPYKTDDILQKRPIILRSLLTVATPYWRSVCIYVCTYMCIFYAYLYMYIYTSVYIHIYTYVYTHTYTYIHSHIYV